MQHYNIISIRVALAILFTLSTLQGCKEEHIHRKHLRINKDAFEILTLILKSSEDPQKSGQEIKCVQHFIDMHRYRLRETEYNQWEIYITSDPELVAATCEISHGGKLYVVCYNIRGKKHLAEKGEVTVGQSIEWK